MVASTQLTQDAENPDQAFVEAELNEDMPLDTNKRHGRKNMLEEIGNVSLTFQVDMLSVSMDRLRVHRATPPPLIPLCRILSHKSIRTIGKERLRLKRIFKEDGYLMEKGDFILSLATSSRKPVLVKDHIKPCGILYGRS